MARRRVRRIKRNSPGGSSAATRAAWTELEQAFFASAPPCDKVVPAPDRFDDLVGGEAGRRDYLGSPTTALRAAWSVVRRLVSGEARHSRAASPL
jgi:hypothetical protein